MNNLHREKLFSLFDEEQAVVYMRGGELMYRDETDYEFPFRQESNFWYLTGVNEPDFHLLLGLQTQEYHLFAPNRDASYATWHGRVQTREQLNERYAPDHLHYDTSFPSVLKELDPNQIYCLDERQAEFFEKFDRKTPIDLEALPEAITHCRVFKTPPELDCMRHAARVNNAAHRAVLRALQPGMYEYELKAIFDAQQVSHGLMQPAYTGIYGSGPNSAIMHYVENNRQIEKGDLFLIDAGYEYKGYASDFTRTYPASGTFTATQAALYQAVLDAQKEVINSIEPEVEMEQLHMKAAEIMMQGLKEADLVSGSIDDLLTNDIFALFFPHGLGHFLGLDTHDVGGYPKGVEKPDRPGLEYLRARRSLQPGMVVTVEPGLYIIPALLQPAFNDADKAPFLNQAKLEPLLGFGGIRIEDNIIVTENGHENITNVPKERAKIEEIMAAG